MTQSSKALQIAPQLLPRICKSSLSNYSSGDICMLSPGCLDNSHKAALCSAKKLPFQRSRNAQHLLMTRMPETEPTLAPFPWRGISVSWGTLREQEGSSSLTFALPEVQLLAATSPLVWGLILREERDGSRPQSQVGCCQGFSRTFLQKSGLLQRSFYREKLFKRDSQRTLNNWNTILPSEHNQREWHANGPQFNIHFQDGCNFTCNGALRMSLLHFWFGETKNILKTLLQKVRAGHSCDYMLDIKYVNSDMRTSLGHENDIQTEEEILGSCGEKDFNTWPLSNKHIWTTSLGNLKGLFDWNKEGLLQWKGAVAYWRGKSEVRRHCCSRKKSLSW